MDAVIGLFNNLVNMGTNMALGVAAFFLLVGAFIYMTAAGSPKQMEKGKVAMLNSVFGMGIALSAKLIMTTLQSALPH